MVQPSRAASECEVDLVRKDRVMQWAQTLDREMDEEIGLRLSDSMPKREREITVPDGSLDPRLPRLRNPNQLRRGKRYRWCFNNDETIHPPRLMPTDKELDWNLPM
jgi:hypothetical protein